MNLRWDGAVIFACGAAVGIIGNLLVHFIAQQDERTLLQRAAAAEGAAASQMAGGNWDQVCTAGPGFTSSGWSERVALGDTDSAVIFLNGATVIAVKKFNRDVIPPDQCFSSAQAPAFFAQPMLQFKATRQP